MAKYDKWSKYDTDKGVVIVFSSMYGNTEKMADIIARFLAEKGIKKIRIHDASKTHPSYIINDIFRYKGVILGSCAYNGNAFPTMETLLFELEHMGVKKWLLLLARLAVARKMKISKRAVISPTLWQINWTKSVDFKRHEKGERVFRTYSLSFFLYKKEQPHSP